MRLGMEDPFSLPRQQRDESSWPRLSREELEELIEILADIRTPPETIPSRP